MTILFLDDDPSRHEVFAAHAVGHQVHHVRTAAQAIERLSNHSYDVVFLDHDLGGEYFEDRLPLRTCLDRTVALAPDIPECEETGLQVAGPAAQEQTGLDVARFMTLLGEWPRLTVVHSFNPVGASRMVEVLARAGFPVTYHRFGRKPYVPELTVPGMQAQTPPSVLTAAWAAVCAMIAGYDSAPGCAQEAAHLARLSIPGLREE